MKITLSRKDSPWPKKVWFGRVGVPVYQRATPNGGVAFMVANNSGQKRRFDCYAEEAVALEQAETLAKRLSERNAVAATLTEAQAIEYSGARLTLARHNLSVAGAAEGIAEAFKTVSSIAELHEALAFWKARRKQTIKKPIRELVAELLAIKETRGASDRYIQDLKYRLNRFAKAFSMDACNVTTPLLQAWLDGEKLKPQAYSNFRRVIHLLFEFAVARGYAAENPAVGVEKVKVRGGTIEIYTPAKIARLLAAASNEFRPILAIGAFAGLRSAELERLEWSDIHLDSRHIIIGIDRAKTATRRIVPIAENLAAWLAPFVQKTGKVWIGTHDGFYDEQLLTAKRTEIKADAEKKLLAFRQ